MSRFGEVYTKMDNISPVVEALQKKVERLVAAYEAQKTGNKQLSNEVEKLQTQVGEQKKTIQDLEEKYKVIKLAKSISGENGEARELKLKINEIVREIDKCVALLNN